MVGHGWDPGPGSSRSTPGPKQQAPDGRPQVAWVETDGSAGGDRSDDGRPEHERWADDPWADDPWADDGARHAHERWDDADADWTGDDPGRADDGWAPAPTAQHLLASETGVPGGLSDHDVLTSLDRTERVVRLALGGAAVLAVLMIAVVAVDRGRGGDGNVIETVGFERALQNAVLVPSTATIPETTTTVLGRIDPGYAEAPEALVAIGDIMADLPQSTAAPKEWVEPDVEPESEWVDPGNGVALPDVLLRIRFCESTNNYQAANGYSSARGAYQFLTKSWVWYGHADRYGVAQAHLATPAQQDEAALLTFRQDGARPWAESRHCWDDEAIEPSYLTAGPPPTTTPPTTAPTPTTTASTTTPSTTTSSTSAPASTTTPSTTAPTTTAPTTSTPPTTAAG